MIHVICRVEQWDRPFYCTFTVKLPVTGDIHTRIKRDKKAYINTHACTVHDVDHPVRHVSTALRLFSIN